MKKPMMMALVCLLTLGLSMTAGAAGGKTLKLAVSADPLSLDPHAQLSGSSLQYSHMVFDPLVRWTRKMTLEPRLATKWERLNDTTTRFTLRKGVKFHGGNPFTAKDVKWTLERLKKSQDYKALFDPFSGAKIIDDYTVDLVTTKPYPLVLNMATYLFPMNSAFYTGTDENGQPKEAIVKAGPSFALTHESGTGKYMVTFREQGVKTVLTKFADYWDTTSPGNVDEIVLTPIKNNDARVTALLSGDADFILPVPPQDYERIGKDPKLKLVTMTGSRLITFQLNQNRRPEFKDKRVRQAIVHAIDNEGIVRNIMKETATVAVQQTPKGFAGHAEDLKPRFDIAKAQALMKETGYEMGFECTMIAPDNRYVNDEKIAETVADMLSRINIGVHLKTMPKDQYWDQFDAQAADIQMIGWHPDTEDGANYSEYLLMCPNVETGYGQYNSGNYCNPKLDGLVLASQAETDPAKRSDMLREVERIAYADAAFIPLHWENPAWAARKNVLLDPIVNAMDFPYFGDLVVK